MFKKFFIDRKYRVPRIWSNRELKKFAHLFSGEVINVSAWKDQDKEGKRYREYFPNAQSYSISNYKAEVMGFQGFDNEFYLDLSQDPDPKYLRRFDVVFNHTTLEHIYNIQKAFANLCSLSRDIVILVVPFLQPMHGDYGDYWRLTPSTVRNLFAENDFTLLYLTFNNQKKASVYIFAIASRNPGKWRPLIGNDFTCVCQKGWGD